MINEDIIRTVIGNWRRLVYGWMHSTMSGWVVVNLSHSAPWTEYTIASRENILHSHTIQEKWATIEERSLIGQSMIDQLLCMMGHYRCRQWRKCKPTQWCPLSWVVQGKSEIVFFCYVQRSYWESIDLCLQLRFIMHRKRSDDDIIIEVVQINICRCFHLISIEIDVASWI